MISKAETHPDLVGAVIDQGTLELVSIIGTGAYGVVYLAIDTRYNVAVHRAVKCLYKVGLDARQRHFQRREIALHQLASSHPSIVTMDRVFTEGDFLFVVMDYGEEGDLFAMITEEQRYLGDNNLVRSVFLQLIDGIAWLHSLGIAHRDIKPENTVCSDNGSRVRIVDFGLATSEVTSSEFGCGSTFYIAPECQGDEAFGQGTGAASYPTQAGDVWSLGVILVNLASGRNPWRQATLNDESFNGFIHDPDFLRKILPISAECNYILQRIFTVDPTQRVSLAELRQLVLACHSFTMDEVELKHAHSLAQQATAATAATAPYPEEYIIGDMEDYSPALSSEASFENQPVFSFDCNSYPSSGSDLSRSSSSGGCLSIPPTPVFLPNDDGKLQLPAMGDTIWDLTGKPKGTSPDYLSAVAPNPFFRC